MRRLIHAFLILAVCAGPFSFGQVIQPIVSSGPIQTGYAVVTPLAGTGQGLSITETFGFQDNGNVFQSSVPPSPLVTLTNVFVSWDLSAGVNTGLAIVNTNDTVETLSLTLLNEQGAVVGTRPLVIGQRQQDSVFITELFAGIPELSRPFAGLLFIDSNLPVAVLGLAFNGASFTSLPVASQLDDNNVFAAGTFGASPSSFVPPPVTLSNTVAPPTFPVTSVPLPGPITPITAPLGTIPTFGTTPLVTTPLGTVPVVNAAGQVTLTVVTPNLTVSTGQFTTASPITEVIVNTGGFLLPQVASGGGWVSQIVIGNTSPSPQIVRIDFFTSSGIPMQLPIGSTIPSIVIPAGGVVVLSTL